jgi:hypothetical protein
MRIAQIVALAALLSATPTFSAAQSDVPTPDIPTTDLITTAMIDDIRKWAAEPVVTISLKSQNLRHEKLTGAEIQELDEQWRAERTAKRQPLIAERLGNPLSNYLTRVQAKSLGLYVEIFVMDERGLNVGQSSITSDFWQGDEAKWQNSYAAGPDGLFIDEAAYHEETGTYRAQVSMSIKDPGTKATIGAITVEINLTEAARRQRLF